MMEMSEEVDAIYYERAGFRLSLLCIFRPRGRQEKQGGLDGTFASHVLYSTTFSRLREAFRILISIIKPYIIL